MKGKLLLLLIILLAGYFYFNWDFQIPDDLSPERAIDTAKSVTDNLGETSTATEKPLGWYRNENRPGRERQRG